MLIEREPMPLLAVDQGLFFGPARVCQVAGNSVQLEFPEEPIWATLALAYPYTPAVGDTVLVVGQNQSRYVIGVLDGKGSTTFAMPGDFEVCAPRGRINLIAGKGVHVKGQEVKITAGKLELVARRVSECFSEVARIVKGTWRIRAAQVRHDIEGEYLLNAGRITERAEQDVKIDGDKIHLG